MQHERGAGDPDASSGQLIDGSWRGWMARSTRKAVGQNRANMTNPAILARF